MIYRIDDALARQQAGWFVAGIVLFCVTILWLRDAILERYRDRRRRHRPAAAAGAGIAQVNGAYLSVDIGPLAFQPTEFAKLCIVVFLASYLTEHGDMLVVGARRVLGVTIPPLKHFGPLLVVWGAAMVMLVFIRDLGSSLMFFGAFLALLYVATGRASFVVAGLALFLAGAWFVAGTRGPRRSASTSGSIRGRTPTTPGSRSPRRCSRRPTAASSARASARRCSSFPGAQIPPAPDTDLIYAVITSEGTVRRRRRGAHLPALRRAGISRRRDVRGRLLEAARHRAHGGVRPAGIRDRGRRHA